MIGKYLVNEQYILETSHWLITSRNEHKMTVNFINPGSVVGVKPDGILVWSLGSNQMESWFGRWGQTRWNPGLVVGVKPDGILVWPLGFGKGFKHFLKLLTK